MWSCPNQCAKYTPCMVARPSERFIEQSEFMNWYRSSNYDISNDGARYALRVTGPVKDGFWTRVLTLLSQAPWAYAMRMPLHVEYNSSQDPYMSTPQTEDGWTQFFEPITTTSLPFAQFDCYASARAWETFANYPTTYEDALAVRARSARLLKAIPVRPRARYITFVNEFWHQKVAPISNVTIGVHLRGTDKPEQKRLTGHFLHALKRYSRGRPRHAVYVASDDSSMLEDFLSSMPPSLRSRTVWRRDIHRGASTLNPGFHAERLHLKGDGDLGFQVLTDTLLLARCTFLIKARSAVSDFAIFFSENNLRKFSYDVTLNQPWTFD